MDFENNENMDDDVYNFLLFTGYLKIQNPVYDNNHRPIENTYELVIPNEETKQIYKTTFQKWFIVYQRPKTNGFINALIHDQTLEATDYLSEVLQNSLSYYDNI